MQGERVAAQAEEQLLSRVAHGEPGAVEACVQKFGALVWSLALKRTASREEAEDAVQEIFVDVWKSAKRYDPGLASEAGFVALIARRRLIDRTRRQARRPTTISLPEGLEPATDEHVVLQRRLEADQVLSIVRGLPEKQRTLIQLSLIEGLSHSQIAERTDIPLGTVKSNIRRGIAEVKRHFIGGAV